MSLYSIADFIVEIQNKYDYLEKQCIEYKYNGNAPADFVIGVTDEDIRQERIQSGGVLYKDGYLESICAYRKLCLALPLKDAMLLHASVISFEGRGIAFLARSGVGKTTHTMLWKQVYREEVKIINGDKPIIRFIKGVPYAYGTPWAGKENLHINDKTVLTDICFIERNTENSVTKLEPDRCFDSLMLQLLHPSDPMAALKTLELSDSLLSACDFWRIECNTSKEAAIAAQEKIFGDKK